MERITILANRLAEAILFDWDKEEVIKLAKEVAVACKENIDFTSLVKRMREAQVKRFEFYTDDGWWADRAIELEKEVDEYLEKMEQADSSREG